MVAVNPVAPSGGSYAAVCAVLAAIVGGLVLAAGFAALEMFREHEARSVRARLEARDTWVDGAVAREASELRAVVEGLIADLEREGGPRLERLAGGGPGAVGEAGSRMRLAGLDMLTVIGSGGSVLSSGHWPEQAGLPAPELASLPAGRAVLRWIDGPGERRLRLVFRGVSGAEARRMDWVGGVDLDREFLERVAIDGATLLLHFDGETVAEAWVSGHAPPPEAVLEGLDPRQWAVSVREMSDGNGRRVAAVYNVLDLDPARRFERRWRGAWLACTALGVAVGCGLGVWVVRRARGPLERLTAAVDAIGAGRADYAFSTGGRDELAGLAQAFTRLQRSLEFQRARAGAAERVAAWREIARRVAHEVKNPLVPIRLTMENLLRARGHGPRAFDEVFEEGTRTILEEVDRLRRLVDEFSQFARLPPLRRRRIELHPLLDGVAELYAATPRLSIVRRYVERPVTIGADADQLHRALHNVVGNAVEAMVEGGGDDPRLEIVTRLDDGQVEIAISDNGPGLSDEARERIFEPYFTTKIQGTGLGMAIAYRIVVEHGGVLEARPAPGRGTSVVLRLPLDSGE